MTANSRMLAGARAIAAYLGVLPRQAQYWAKSGLMPSFKVGSTLCADPQALDAWKAELQAKAATRAAEAA